MAVLRLVSNSALGVATRSRFRTTGIRARRKPRPGSPSTLDGNPAASIRISFVTRPGLSMAKRAATPPPIELPPSAKRSSPSADANSSTKPAIAFWV